MNVHDVIRFAGFTKDPAGLRDNKEKVIGQYFCSCDLRFSRTIMGKISSWANGNNEKEGRKKCMLLQREKGKKEAVKVGMDKNEINKHARLT